MLFATLLLFGAAQAPQDEGRLALETVVDSGVAMAAALAPEGKRLFAAHGLRLVELALADDGWNEVDSVDTGVAPLAMQVDERRVYLAAGTEGCWAADYSVGVGEPYRLTEEPDSLCMDVAWDRQRVAVLFSNYATLTVHVLDRATLGLRQRIRVPNKRAYALALDGHDLYVACGSQGVLRLNLRSERPASERQRAQPVDGWIARDLGLAQGKLWVAADAAGLVGLELGSSFGLADQYVPYNPGTKAAPLYAARVAAFGDRLAVGFQTIPAFESDALPLGSLGERREVPRAGDQELHLVQASELIAGPEATAASVQSLVLQPGAWRSLALQGPSLLMQRRRQGLQLANLDTGTGPSWSPAWNPPGLIPLDGCALPSAKVLMAQAPASDPAVAGLRLGASGAKAWTVEPPLGPLGTSFDAAWRSARGSSGKSSDWVLTGGAEAPRILNAKTLEGRVLKLPLDPEGLGGHSSFHSRQFGDYIAISRIASRDGLLIYRKSALESFALGDLAETPNAFAVLNTTAPEVSDPPRIWSTDALDMGNGRWLLVCAAGSGRDPEDPELPLPRLLTFLVDGDGARFLGSAMGADGPAEARGIVAFEVHGRRWALLTSTNGKLDLFDLTNPGAPKSTVHQPIPQTPWDATSPALLDVEFLHPADHPPQALIAAGRSGLLRLDLAGLTQSPPRPDLIPDERHPTPGVATGIVIAASPTGGTRIILSDQAGGARVYRWRFGKLESAPPR